MGLDTVKNTAWGFCFVEYCSRTDAENVMWYSSGARLDDPIICTDWDATLRQTGSGRCSGWVRDEHLQGCDAGRGAMENWFVNTESPVMKNSLLWPIEFDVHYPGSANAPILPSFDQCLCGVGSLFMVFFWKLKDRTQKNDFNSIVLEYWPCDFLTRSKTVFLGNRFDL